MIRKVRIKTQDGVFSRIQCPNPTCDNILEMDPSEYGNGMNRMDMVCNVCGDDISIEYIILGSPGTIQEMMSARASFVSNNKGNIAKEG